MSDVIENEFMVQNFFTFDHEILTQDSYLYMASLDVDALLKNIPLDETVHICVKKHFFLLKVAIRESFLTFNNKFHIQVDGAALGSPLGPILANMFFWHHAENRLNEYPIEFNSSFYRSYVKIFLYFLNHLNLPTRFVNIAFLNTRI